MFGDIFGKINEMKQKVEDAKAQLETVSVAGESPDGRVKIVANGNKVIKSVEIEESLRTGDPEELEDQLILALNKTLEKAENVHSTTMSGATSDLLPPHLMNMLNNS